MNYDHKSNAWHEGRMAKKIQDYDNPYESGTIEEGEWQEGHDFVAEICLLEDMATITAPGQAVGHSPFGWIIGEDGTCYALHYQYTHGVICALLYPELAKAHESGLPERGDYNVFAFQRFEHDMASKMKVMRVATSMMTDRTYFSKSSSHRATPAQLQAVIAICRELGIRGRDKLMTEFGNVTVSELVEHIRNDYREPLDDDEDDGDE